MEFKGQAKKLSLRDVGIIAGYLGCEVAAVQAVLSVEARNSGFDGLGRPKMLFEPHVFWRELGPGSQRERAKALGLAYSKWKPGSYPADSYPRLLAAMKVNRTAALRSASWGMGQVMGFNHQRAGFDTVEEFVRAMTYSEGAHLYAMARFIVSKGLQKYLRELRWSPFAKGYNGSGYAKHGYHTKLKKAYEQRPSTERNVPPPPGEAELNALLGLAVPPKPEPKPDWQSDDMIPAPQTPKHHWLEALIGVIIAAGAAFFGYMVIGD